jgi:hypothetical protein
MHAVVRIDPVIPFVTDSRDELEELLRRARDCGASHVVASALDVPMGMKSSVLGRLDSFGDGTTYDIEKLYSERIHGSLNAKIGYRRNLFTTLREECDKLGLTFALCMEFELLDGQLTGLNSEFMSSSNCEGIDIPVYVRDGAVFRPAADCSGNCLSCSSAICGLEELALARADRTRKSFRLSDYRRWTREIRRSVGEEQKERGLGVCKEGRSDQCFRMSGL